MHRADCFSVYEITENDVIMALHSGVKRIDVRSHREASSRLFWRLGKIARVNRQHYQDDEDDKPSDTPSRTRLCDELEKLLHFFSFTRFSLM